MDVTLVVPCYQEAEALEAWRSLLPDLPAREIVFVDDGSTDATNRRLADLARRDGRVRVASHAANLGVGAAMRTGFMAASGDVVVVYDADRTYPPADVARLVRGIEDGADVVTASPWAAAGSAAGVPVGRRLLSRAATAAYRLVVGGRGLHVTTFTCAFRAYRREVLRGLRFGSQGFGAAAEILGRLLLAGHRVVEVPSRLRPRRQGRSKMRVLGAAREHLAVLRSLWRARTGARAGEGAITAG